MNEKFSSTDIVEIAIEIEKNGRSFYEGFSRKAEDNAIAQFFSNMAEEEAQHEKDFKAILSSVMSHQPCDAYPQEYFSYLNAVAGGYLFKDSDEFKERTSGIGSEKDAIDFSLGIEKDSILLYEEIKKMIPDKERHLIESIINQEREHVKKLWDLRKPKA